MCCKQRAEDSPTDPLSPYADTNLFFEKVLRWYGSAYGLRFVCLRYFNAAGADPGGELGEHHDPETHLIPAGGPCGHEQRAATGFRDGLPDTRREAIRDYTHVTDLAEAHVLALQPDGGQ